MPAASLKVIELIDLTHEFLQQHAEVGFAEGCRKFFVEPVNPWGVRSKHLKVIEVTLYKELRLISAAERYRFAEQLWRTGQLEEGIIASHVLRRFNGRFGREEWALFSTWLGKYVNNWCHCDSIASWLLAGCIANRSELKEYLAAWTQDGNRWRRRAAAVALLQEAKRGRSTEAIREIAHLLAKDSDVMVQKGLGWLLKETYPKQPAEAVQILEEIAPPRLVVRYAAEKMTPEDRARFGLKPPGSTGLPAKRKTAKQTAAAVDSPLFP
jgi:3-methyladenine DNA glycosylase AlkD